MRSRGVVLTLCAASATGFVTCTRSTSLTEIFTNWCICQPCNLCSYTLFQGCDVLLTNAVSTSDGSDIPTRQPLLASSDWFLTADEITNARGGVPRTSLATSSSGNFMHIFADTSSTFAAIHHDLLKADAAYFTSWTLGDIPYLPHIDPAITFKSTWGKAITTNNLSAHGLVWANLPQLDRVTDMHAWMNSLTPSHGARVQLLIDDRVTSITGSLHQKSLVLSKDNQLWAYAGGMDQAFDRWDTKYHNESALRNAAHIRTNNNGWIDVHSRVLGPAAVDILHNFLDRWNDPKPPGPALGPPFVTPPMPLQASWNVPQNLFSSAALLSSLAINTSAGPHDVQILRTFSCNYHGYASFAPHGETSILAGRIKAIRNAKNYIYIEDQYFVYMPDLFHELLSILPTLQRLVVFTVTPGKLERASGYAKYQYDMINPLLQKFPNKVQIYIPKPSLGIYVHSKVLLVDDVLVSIGSSNWNVRSMTSDAEIGQQIVDTTRVIVENDIQGTKLAHDFRISKFGELTNFTVDFANLSFLQAANALETYAQRSDAWIEPYMLYEKPYWVIYGAGAKNLVDGDGRCTSAVPLSLCKNDTWLQAQYQVIQITCSCELAGIAVSKCDNMTDYLNAGQASAEAAFINKALLYYGGIFAGVSLGVLLVLCGGCCYGRKWHRNRRKQAVSPAAKAIETK